MGLLISYRGLLYGLAARKKDDRTGLYGGFITIVIGFLIATVGLAFGSALYAT
jgi:hypothetical protein